MLFVKLSFMRLLYAPGKKHQELSFYSSFFNG